MASTKKNNDILTAAPTPGQLEEKMEAVLEVCLKRNMKLSPSKFHCARQVSFGRVTIESLKQRGNDKRRMYLTPEDKKVKHFLDIQSPKSKNEIQHIYGMTAQLKC